MSFLIPYVTTLLRLCKLAIIALSEIKNYSLTMYMGGADIEN